MLVGADQCQQTQQKPELTDLTVDACENTMNPVHQLFAPCKGNHAVCMTNTSKVQPTNLHCTQHFIASSCWPLGAHPSVPNFYGKRSLWYSNSNPCPHTAPAVSRPCCNTHSCPTCAFGMSSCAKASPDEYWFPYDYHHLCSSGSSHEHTPSGDW